MIDSFNGLMNSMSEEQALTVQLHELLSYLNQWALPRLWCLHSMGCWAVNDSPTDVSYLADNVLLLRYFEAGRRSAAGYIRDEAAVGAA